jgi:spore coat polysaccharide biosynthesis predicted glycosyltransferase SpsG
MIKILTDGNSKIGYGHISRSKALYSFLKHKFSTSLEIISESSSKYSKIFNSKITIVDLPLGYDHEVLRAKKSSDILVCLDYFGGISIDYNIVVFPHTKPVADFSTFIGLDYIILRKDILTLKNNRNTKENYFLVTIGGADINNYSFSIAHRIHESGYNVKVCLGPLYDFESQNIYPFEVLINPPNFHELLNNASIVICNGGGTLFESLYLNKKCYVIPQSKEEENIANYLLERKLILGLGIDNFQSMDINNLNKIKIRISNIIDGFGVNRITEIVINIIKLNYGEL